MSSNKALTITTHHTYLPSPFPSAPSFHLHLTRLKDTLMLWVGTGPPSDSSVPGLEASTGPDERRLAGDWAVAMPSRGVSVFACFLVLCMFHLDRCKVVC